MNVDLAELKAKALAATPGEWMREDRTVYALMHHGWRKGEELFKNRMDLRVFCDRNHMEEEEANAAYIAAASPPVVLALIERLQRAEKDNAKFRSLTNPLNGFALAEAALSVIVYDIGMFGTILSKLSDEDRYQLKAGIAQAIERAALTSPAPNYPADDAALASSPPQGECTPDREPPHGPSCDCPSAVEAA